MSRTQRQEVTVSAFLQMVQEARANHLPRTLLLRENLRITAGNDSASNNLLDLSYLHFRNVDFRDLDASGALCEGAVAYRCNFQESNWSNAQGDFQIHRSDVSIANFTGAEIFLFVDSYQANPAIGLTTEQTQSITPVSYYTSILLDTCDDHHVNYIIEEQKRISGLEATVAALAAQVDRLREQR